MLVGLPLPCGLDCGVGWAFGVGDGLGDGGAAIGLGDAAVPVGDGDGAAGCVGSAPGMGSNAVVGPPVTGSRTGVAAEVGWPAVAPVRGSVVARPG